MVKHTRRSRKIMDDENNTCKKRVANGKGFSTSGSSTTDTSGLKRSARETSSRKQMISSPSSTWVVNGKGFSTSGSSTTDTSGLRRSARETSSRKQMISSPSSTRVVNGKGFSTSGSSTTDTSGLRRSARETSSKKQMISSPSSTRKSERLEKRMPNTPPNKKKHESIERQSMPCPLRRSGRGKEQPSSSCLGSKKSEKCSGPSDIKIRNLERDKNRERKEPEPIHMINKKRMDACTYKTLFKQQLRRDALHVASVISAPASGIPADYGCQSLPTPTASLSDTLHTNDASTLLSFSISMVSLPEVHLVGSEKRTLPNMQKSFHPSLEPVISKLCEILQLSEDVKVMVGRFLGYIIDNHHLNSESVAILQAFQISVCWVAASLMKQTIDRKETLVLAKKHLGFSCKEEEANNVYLKLRSLKQAFLCNTHVIESESEHNTKEQKNVKLELDEKLQKQKNCENRMEKLQKQREEIRELHRTWEDERVQMEKKYRMESAIVRSIHSHIPVRTDKLKVLDNEFARKLEEHKLAKEIRLKDLEARHLKERKEQSGFEIGEPMSDSEDLQEERSPEGVLHDVEPSGALPEGFPETGPGEEVECITHIGTSTLALNPNCEYDEVETIDPERRSVAGSDQRNRLGDFRDGLESAVLVNQPSEVQISDGAQSSIRDQEDHLEMPGKVGASHFMGIIIPDVESNGGNKEGDESDMPNAAGNLSDTVSSFVDGNSLSTEKSLEKSELLQQVITTPGQGGQLQQYMALRDELSQQSTHIGIQDGDAPTDRNQITLQQVEVPALHPIDAGPTDPTNDEPVLPEPVNQPQPRPFTDLPITSFQNAEAPSQTVQNPPELSNQLLFPPGATDLSFGPNQPNSSSDSRFGFHTNLLQNELERLCKDRDQVIKLHEEAKLRLSSDCEKEIEDIIAQIRSKYEAKLEDAEATFLLRKKEININHNIVLMNKILAQAFRSDCLDLKPSFSLSSQQTVPPSFMQPPRRHHVTSSSSAGPLVVPPAPHIQPSTSMPISSGIQSLPRGMPGQQALSNIRATSLSIPQPPPLAGGGGVSSAFYKSPSPLELLMDVDNRSGAHPLNNLTSVSYLSSKFNSLVLSEFGAPGNDGNN